MQGELGKRGWATAALMFSLLAPGWVLGSPGAGAPPGSEQKAEKRSSGSILRRLLPFAKGSQQKPVGEAKSRPGENVPGAPRPAVPAPPSGDEYVIGPEDVLGIHVWQEPQISRSVPVRPDGRISLPLVGDVNAAGQTPSRLQATIAAALKEYLAHPQVTVIVEKVNSQKFNILGEVQRPGSYDLGKPVTVLDAIALAGGFRDFAKVKNIYVIRKLAGGSTTRLPFNYRDFIKGKDTAQNVKLEPGDTVVVP